MNWETYIAFGDSITKGARTYLGYPELVGSQLTSHLLTQWNVVNHSVCGFKAIDLARYIDTHFLSLKEKQSSISTILIGTNDIKEKTQAADFRIALEQVILKTKLLTINSNVILMTIPEFHRGITYPYSMEMNNQVVALNAEIKALTDKHDIRMLSIDHHADDFTDGVHLNDQGLRTFSSQISRYILKDKGIELN